MKSVTFSVFSLLLLVSVFDLRYSTGVEEEEGFIAMATLGGVSDVTVSNQNNAEMEELARFAVEEHNKKQNAVLEFGKLVKAKQQVVAGTLYHLTVEAIEAGKKKLYEAKVWVKPWLNFKELQEFKHVGDSSSFTNSDLGAKQGFFLNPRFQYEEGFVYSDNIRSGVTKVIERLAPNVTFAIEATREIAQFRGKIGRFGDLTAQTAVGIMNPGDHAPGWRTVPAHDPVVKEAADHAVKTIQQRSNSLAPYELLEILLAKAEVIGEFAKFDMLLKLKRGTKEEKYKVEVHKNHEGKYLLNQMQQDHDHSCN